MKKRMKIIRVFADGREMESEIKNGVIKLYGDEVEIRIVGKA